MTEPGKLISPNSDIETRIFHLLVDFWACVPFSEPDFPVVAGKNFDDKIKKRRFFMMVKYLSKLLLENVYSVRNKTDVIFYALKEEPSGISCIESCVITLIVKVGYQAVALYLCEVDDSVLGLRVQTSL